MNQLIWCDIKKSLVDGTEMSTCEDSDVESEKRMYCYIGENILRSLEKSILVLSERFASFDDVNILAKFERRAGPSKRELASNRVLASRSYSRPTPWSSGTANCLYVPRLAE